MITYFVIGMIYTAVFSMIILNYLKNSGYDVRLNIFGMLALTVLWPLHLLITIFVLLFVDRKK